MNPCDEIMLGDPQPAMPWVQAQLMNSFRVKNGKPPYTMEEIAAIVEQLESHVKS